MASPDPAFVENVFAEFRRIGFDPESVPILVTSGVTSEEFLEKLRAIPTGAGLEAVSAMMNALPHLPPPLWSVYPDAGDLFSYDDFMAAFVLNQILGAGRIPCESQRHPIEGVEVRQGLFIKTRRGRGRCVDHS